MTKGSAGLPADLILIERAVQKDAMAGAGRLVIASAMLSGFVLGGAAPGYAAQSALSGANGVSGCALGFIALDPAPGGIRITGRALGLAACSGTAELTVERTGSGRHMRTRQGGAFDLGSAGRANLAEIILSMGAGDRLTARLVLNSGGRTIATSTVDTDE